MGNSWTFSAKIAAGFAAMTALIVGLAFVSVRAINAVVATQDEVVSTSIQARFLASRLEANNYRRLADFRSFLITRDEADLQSRRAAQAETEKIETRLQALMRTPEERALMNRVDETTRASSSANDVAIERAKAGARPEAITLFYRNELEPKAERRQEALNALIAHQEAVSAQAIRASDEAASRAANTVIGIGTVAGALAAVLAFVLSRLLSRQIGSAVRHIQSSSSELQAAANQQTSGTREQVTSMNEISTTIKELLSTSRQIAESAQRVSQIAAGTATTARTGDLTVQKAKEAIQTIQRQVDQIVSHMLDLGRKSQQAGGILELINELSEQTNILAINATIEAAGAGEMGRRFAVVAEEIRKLADRVGGSTKDIRGLIEEIRAAVNTTVMATESGSKAVEAGSRQFSEVTVSFSEIGGMVKTATEAAREIELSTKQQTSSVEQVSAAIASIAQSAKESEASSTQTLQTVSELTALSRNLAQLVQAQGQA